MKTFKNSLQLLTLFLTLSTFSMAGDTAREIEVDANEALAEFFSEVHGSQKFLASAKGYVVFPDVKEAGFFFVVNMQKVYFVWEMIPSHTTALHLPPWGFRWVSNSTL